MPADYRQIKILCLSFHTPPAVRPQAILFNKMVREFLIAGLNPVIATGSKEPWEIGTRLVHFLPGRFKFLNRFPIIKEINNWLYIEQLYRQLKKTVREEKIEMVFSFSNPQITNILGALLKKRLGLKFISHFSDPWYNNPLRHDKFLGKFLIGLKQKFIIKHSDKIIFTNDNALQFIMSPYPEAWKKKAVVVPHCFSRDDYPPASADNHEKYVISHIGVFYEQRKPLSFFRALSLASMKFPELTNKLQVRLIGSAEIYTTYSSEDLISSIKNYGLENIVKMLPRVGYEKSLEYMVGSDCLLVIDPELEFSPFLPSKLIDYAGSHRMIIGLTPKGSPTEKFLSQAGYRSFGHNETDALADYLVYLSRERPEIVPNNDFIAKFEAKNTAHMFLEIFNEVNQL